MEKPSGQARPVPVPAERSSIVRKIPQRKSSQNFSMALLASAMVLTPPQSSKERQRTVASRGRSTSPIRLSRLGELRRAPSRTFIPPIVPTDILDFPKVSHPRIAINTKLSTPVSVGGATVEGEVYITFDDGKASTRRKTRPPILLRRIVVSLIAIEYSNGRKWIFRSLATDLIDEAHPPPTTMLAVAPSSSGTQWEVVPSMSVLPFRLDLPVIMGPPPYKGKKVGIKYVVSTTVEAKIADKAEFVRESQDVAVLTVHDPEKALVNLASPLLTTDELHVPGAGRPSSIKLTAGLHRQTWISGYVIFIDILIDNCSHKTVGKVDIQLEKATVLYNSAAASTRNGVADALRLPDHCNKEIVSRITMRAPQDAVAPHSETVRTCRLEIPVGLASVDTGRFFGVRFFLNVQISCSMSKRLSVSLPITIIHPNSVDVPPNSLAQVAAAVEHKHRDHPSRTGSPYRFTAGRAFAAARERSYDQLRVDTLPESEVRILSHNFDGSPRRVRHRRSHIGVNSGSSRSTAPQSTRPASRPQSSLDVYGPKLQRSTSGMAFDDSDKENRPVAQTSSPTKEKRKSRPFSRLESSVLRELDLTKKRSSTLSGWRNVAAEAANL